MTPQLPGAQRSSGTNSVGINASNMLPPHDGVTRIPAYGSAPSNTVSPRYCRVGPSGFVSVQDQSQESGNARFVP